MRIRSPILLLLLLGGCTFSLGVETLGADRYALGIAASPLIGGGAEAQRLAFERARQLCAETGRVSYVEKAYRRGRDSSVTFRCVTPEVAQRLGPNVLREFRMH